MNDFRPWSWSESLGGVSARTGESYRIQTILFGTVEDRCRDLGLGEGGVLRFRNRNDEGVEVELESGEVRRIPLPYSWFVEVAPIDREVRPG